MISSKLYSVRFLFEIELFFFQLFSAFRSRDTRVHLHRNRNLFGDLPTVPRPPGKTVFTQALDAQDTKRRSRKRSGAVQPDFRPELIMRASSVLRSRSKQVPAW